MPEQPTQTINIEKEAVRVDPSLILQPGAPQPITPSREVNVPVQLYPSIPEVFEPPAPVFETERDLLINLETTGVHPWDSKLISIAYLDLTQEGAMPEILASDDEEGMLNEFLRVVEDGNFTRLVGWKLTFDFRWIFSLMALYRTPSKKFYSLKLRDVKQIYDQVKEEFVYFPDRKGTLNDWGLMVLGAGKLAGQKEVLKRYLAGDFDFIKAFQIRQIELTRDLYNLARFLSSESFKTAPSLAFEQGSLIKSPETSTFHSMQPEKECSKCLQLNPADRTECLVCGEHL